MQGTNIPAKVFKICDDALWRTLQNAGQTEGSADDLRDGFIHFSTREQLLATFEKYFAAAFQRGDLLWVLEIDTGLLPHAALRMEVSRMGQLFPHLYAPLELNAVLSARSWADAHVALGLSASS